MFDGGPQQRVGLVRRKLLLASFHLCQAAGKEMRDNWAVGFTTRYTVGVWVGNFSGAPMHDVSGIDGAAPIWREVMDFLHEGHVPEPQTPPDGIVRQRITYGGGLEPGKALAQGRRRRSGRPATAGARAAGTAGAWDAARLDDRDVDLDLEGRRAVRGGGLTFGRRIVVRAVAAGRLR